jgi:indoleamine 2,3-dioxygenase
MVLAFLMHFYVHSGDHTNSSVIVPRSIAVPLARVSRALGTAPVLTYADTVLWNARAADPNHPIAPDNLAFEHAFSCTPDEVAFYAASARVELQGAAALRLIHAHMQSDADSGPTSGPHSSDADLASTLEQLTSHIDAMTDAISAVRTECDPHVFHAAIRPWFCGSDARGPGGPGSGWTLDGVAPSDPLHALLSGPSGGQSALVHALDGFLDIDHALSPRSAARAPAPTATNHRADRGFMARMRLYMPARQRAFLECLDGHGQAVRARAAAADADAELREAYNGAVGALRRLRDVHIRVACLYVVAAASAAAKACPVMARMAAEEKRQERDGPARGTGGLEVALQLKAGRDATRRAIV